MSFYNNLLVLGDLLDPFWKDDLENDLPDPFWKSDLENNLSH